MSDCNLCLCQDSSRCGGYNLTRFGSHEPELPWLFETPSFFSSDCECCWIFMPYLKIMIQYDLQNWQTQIALTDSLSKHNDNSKSSLYAFMLWLVHLERHGQRAKPSNLTLVQLRPHGWASPMVILEGLVVTEKVDTDISSSCHN